MKKRYVGYGISILLICLITGGLIWLQADRSRNRTEKVPVQTTPTGASISKREYPDKIPVLNWNGLDKKYCICNTKIKSDFYNNEDRCDTTFQSDVSLEEMIQTNRKDYLGMIDYYTARGKGRGALFFKDDNYYVLSYDESWGTFIAECCYSEYTYDHYSTYIPTPVELYLDPDVVAGRDEKGYYELDLLFNNYSFDEFCRFYERMSPDLYKIDKEKQTVTLAGYDLEKEKMRGRFITFDFKNQAVIGPDDKGKTVTISKYKQPSPSPE